MYEEEWLSEEKPQAEMLKREGVIQVKKLFWVEIWKFRDHFVPLFFFLNKSLSFGSAIYRSY